MRQSDTLKSYYYLTKPGIIYGNALMVIAGYFYGAHGSPHWVTFLSVLVGTSLVIGSACAYNNVMDRKIDLMMERTKKRAVPSGRIRTSHALTFATVLLVLGILLLLYGTNFVTTLVTLGGHIAYVILYGIGKRKTVHGTLIGTISGSTPPVIGYAAATGEVDLIAGLLFLILVAWQMPHFYAIAIFRRDDYAKAHIPVLSVVRGLDATRRQIIFYVILFVLGCIMLGLFGGASILTTLVSVLAGFYWLYLCLRPAPDGDQNRWARKQFGWSLMLLIILCASWSLDSFFH